MVLPEPRGPVSERLLEALVEPVHELRADPTPPSGEEDLHLSLYLLYELHYRGLPGAHPAWEWEPSLLHRRRELPASSATGR